MSNRIYIKKVVVIYYHQKLENIFSNYITRPHVNSGDHSGQHCHTNKVHQQAQKPYIANKPNRWQEKASNSHNGQPKSTSEWIQTEIGIIGLPLVHVFLKPRAVYKLLKHI